MEAYVRWRQQQADRAARKAAERQAASEASEGVPPPAQAPPDP